MIKGLDHIALTARDLEKTCAFYADLFGATVGHDLKKDGRSLVRQMHMTGAMLSVHQEGNGIDLVARRPAPGTADFCFQWDGPIESAMALLESHGVAIEVGPVPRRTNRMVKSNSIYFRDPDENLVELMAEDA
jgi:catechol 2,3-dioxygenase-like lactoylglutathione lyase family enzyme